MLIPPYISRPTTIKRDTNLWCHDVHAATIFRLFSFFPLHQQSQHRFLYIKARSFITFCVLVFILDKHHLHQQQWSPAPIFVNSSSVCVHSLCDLNNERLTFIVLAVILPPLGVFFERGKRIKWFSWQLVLILNPTLFIRLSLWSIHQHCIDLSWLYPWYQ